jgi:hypothetical protein
VSDRIKPRGRGCYREPPPLEPFDAIRVGSIIRWNRRQRTVRTITRHPNGAVYCVQFAKVARSGYRCPLTVYYRSELRKAFGGIVAHRKGPLCAVEMECALSKWIDEQEASVRYIDPPVTERETVGVIW